MLPNYPRSFIEFTSKLPFSQPSSLSSATNGRRRGVGGGRAPDGHADGTPGRSGEPTADPPVRWPGATPPVAFWPGGQPAGPLSSLLTAVVLPPGVGAGAWPGFGVPQGPPAASSSDRSKPTGSTGGLPAAAVAAGASAPGLAASAWPSGPAASGLVVGSWPGGAMPGGGGWQEWIAASATLSFQADLGAWPDGVLTGAAASATSSAARLDKQVPVRGTSAPVGAASARRRGGQAPRPPPPPAPVAPPASEHIDLTDESYRIRNEMSI